VHRRPRILRHSAVSLVLGFVVAIGVTAVVALAGRALGWFGPELLGADRPGTGFITQPDRWSLVVAALAGIAGVLSLTSSKSGALVGVFISVTTVPAAGDMALSLALGGSAEFAAAATQLGINLVGIVVAATATLAVQYAFWHSVPGAAPGIDRVDHPRQHA
ncbi:MAG: putative integral rane protein, partial [Blastococcus sp.]|nr:putative integral rane protein [Blastococcus sp.]